jgi:general secretion pathway protein J
MPLLPYQQKGFTLLEIIIAMAIMAIVSVTTIKLLDEASLSKDTIEKSSKRLNQLQRGFLLISQDMQQLVSRSYRDEFGDKQLSMSTDLQSSTPIFRFTRLGRRNPAQLPRSNLEHLNYLVEDKVLYRVSFTYTDGMTEEQGLKRPLLDNVEDMKIEFYDGQDWHETWPVQDSITATNTAKELPIAVKFKLEFSDYGIIERLYAISDPINNNQQGRGNRQNNNSFNTPYDENDGSNGMPNNPSDDYNIGNYGDDY